MNDTPQTSEEALPSNVEQLRSPAYTLAALDQGFLLGDSMRGVRFLLEYAKAEECLRSWGVRSTIVVFGSARVREDGPESHARWYREARAFARVRLGMPRRSKSYGRPNKPMMPVEPLTWPLRAVTNSSRVRPGANAVGSRSVAIRMNV